VAFRSVQRGDWLGMRPIRCGLGADCGPVLWVLWGSLDCFSLVGGVGHGGVDRRILGAGCSVAGESGLGWSVGVRRCRGGSGEGGCWSDIGWVFCEGGAGGLWGGSMAGGDRRGGRGSFGDGDGRKVVTGRFVCGLGGVRIGLKLSGLAC